MITTFESLIRKRATKAGYRIVKSGSPHGDYTLQNFKGYVVMSPVSIEEIDKFLAESEDAERECQAVASVK
jgi:hypothetical protein